MRVARGFILKVCSFNSYVIRCGCDDAWFCFTVGEQWVAICKVLLLTLKHFLWNICNKPGRLILLKFSNYIAENLSWRNIHNLRFCWRRLNAKTLLFMRIIESTFSLEEIYLIHRNATSGFLFSDSAFWCDCHLRIIRHAKISVYVIQETEKFTCPGLVISLIKKNKTICSQVLRKYCGCFRWW